MEIQIGRWGRECAACETRFVHEAQLVSTAWLVEGALERKDYCKACWSADFGEGTYSTWESQFYDPQVADQQPEESFSPLRKTFYEAVELNDRASLAVAYLAAQLLRRQKVFRLIKESTDPDSESALLLFNDRIGNRLIEVRDPSLSHAELDVGRTTLMERLNQLEQPPEESDDESEESADEVSTDESASEESHGQLEQANA